METSEAYHMHALHSPHSEITESCLQDIVGAGRLLQAYGPQPEHYARSNIKPKVRGVPQQSISCGSNHIYHHEIDTGMVQRLAKALAERRERATFVRVSPGLESTPSNPPHISDVLPTSYNTQVGEPIMQLLPNICNAELRICLSRHRI